MKEELVVECYAGYAYPERPTAFVWQGKKRHIDRVLRQWYTPAGLAFRVLTTEGAQLTLLYDQAQDSWHFA